MTSERWQQIEDILDQVMPRPPGERTAQLDRLCGEDATLRGEVEEMLIYCDQAQKESFLEKPPVLAAEALDLGSILTEEADADLEAGMMVGPYRIVEPLGSGGMGEVYLAERTDPHMRVALKVVKRGMDTNEILRRFRYEREILARLEHPNIARLHDAGVTDDGRPYFAMEYVEQGQTLDAYCDDHHLSVRARLELFTTVCEAVRYAHRNLVVHRDLKPGNILVSEDEAGQPQVKLLDFGIAKLLEEDAALQTIQMTEAGARRMTPNYAAPEQVIGGPTTTATDVYALGVILYKLLTGRRPYHFEDRSVTGLEQIIRHKIPERPSTVVVRSPRSNGAAGTTPEHLSLQRAASPKGLRRQLKGDLDAIVLMALRKESERRYASGGEFLDDIQRYLDNHPVVAQHDSVAYRASKFVRRHRAGVSITVAVVLLISTLVGFFTAQLTSERDLANQERDRALSTRDVMIKMIEMRDPDGLLVARDVVFDTVYTRMLIRTGLSNVEDLLDPRDQAYMLDIMGQVSLSYGLFDQADSLYRRALKIKIQELRESDPDLAVSLFGLGQVAHNLARNEEADSLYRWALHLLERASPKQRRLIPKVQDNLAFVLGRMDRLDEAKELYFRALEAEDELLRAVPEDKEIQLLKAQSLRGLATILRRQDLPDEAEIRYREALALLSKGFGEAHPDIAKTKYGLAYLLRAKGDLEGAEAYHLEALEIYRKAYGDEHPAVGNSLYALAQLSQQMNNYEQAETYYLQVIEIDKATRSPGDPQVALAINNLGYLLLKDRDDPARAEPYLREVLEMGLRAEEYQLARAKYYLGRCLIKLSRYAEAEPLLLDSYHSFKDNPRRKGLTRGSLAHLVELYRILQRPRESARYAAQLEQLNASIAAQEN